MQYIQLAWMLIKLIIITRKWMQNALTQSSQQQQQPLTTARLMRVDVCFNKTTMFTKKHDKSIGAIAAPQFAAYYRNAPTLVRNCLKIHSSLSWDTPTTTNGVCSFGPAVALARRAVALALGIYTRRWDGHYSADSALEASASPSANRP